MTTDDLPLFNTMTGRDLKQIGQERAAESAGSRLEWARDLAREIARGRADREVTADDVGRELKRHGLDSTFLGAGAGSLFKGSEWEWTGRRVNSMRMKNHAREIRVWRWVGAQNKTKRTKDQEAGATT